MGELPEVEDIDGEKWDFSFIACTASIY